ncbi:MAG: hypothetical protein KAI66_27025 [Lentisphaeria bacterium]|nr:hypothetical protein [Lentisphaeria bacterium]
MCNLAGYVGRERAAPILVGMMGRQEGFGGGYYTGIATVADGKLHVRKVVGDLVTLLEETDAAELPGTVGIIHSRSKSGGDVEYGHPFVDASGELAYVANGHIGFYEDQGDPQRLVAELESAGMTFRSLVHGTVGCYPSLPDGRTVHLSEITAMLIGRAMRASGDPLEAMRRAYLEYPGEIVGLAVHSQHPGSVFAARFNQPLTSGQGETGMFMATTALAFPDEGIDWLGSIPPCTAARIGSDGITMLPFREQRGTVAETMPWAEGTKAVLEELDTQDCCGIGALKNATASLWPKEKAPQKDRLVYEILHSLAQQGRVRFEDRRVPGVLEGTHAPFRVAAGI